MRVRISLYGILAPLYHLLVAAVMVPKWENWQFWSLQTKHWPSAPLLPLPDISEEFALLHWHSNSVIIRILLSRILVALRPDKSPDNVTQQSPHKPRAKAQC